MQYAEKWSNRQHLASCCRSSHVGNEKFRALDQLIGLLREFDMHEQKIKNVKKLCLSIASYPFIGSINVSIDNMRSFTGLYCESLI